MVSYCTGTWTILSPIEQSIKQKVESLGTPLKEWNINIYRGILTGLNKAFIIDQETRNNLVKSSPKSEEIIRPILRGRDIKRFKTENPKLYLISAHNGVKHKNIPPIDVKDDYPEIFNHLSAFGEKIRNRTDKGDYWSNLRNCAYIKDFESPKIIYPEITKFLNFYFDKDGEYYTNNKCFILNGDNLEYLTAFFNSPLFRFCFTENFPELMGGTREMRKVFFEQIPVLKVSEEINELFKRKLKEHKESLTGESEIEEEINSMIFKIYSLTDEEIEQVLSSQS